MLKFNENEIQTETRCQKLLTEISIAIIAKWDCCPNPMHEYLDMGNGRLLCVGSENCTWK